MHDISGPVVQVASLLALPMEDIGDTVVAFADSLAAGLVPATSTAVSSAVAAAQQGEPACGGRSQLTTQR